MKVKLIGLLCVVFALALLGCSEDTLANADDAEAAALATVGSGTVSSSERVVDEGHRVWAVMVTMPNGAELEVILFAGNGELFEIKDTVGPFDYALSPLPGMSTYAEALASALDANPGTVEAWEVKLSVDDDRYFYEFYVRDDGGQLYEIKHWADDGSLLEFQAVDEID